MKKRPTTSSHNSVKRQSAGQRLRTLRGRYSLLWLLLAASAAVAFYLVAYAGNAKDFFQNTAMTTSTNYSPAGAPTNADDVRLTSGSTSLVITTASVVMESLSAANGSSYSITNGGSSGDRTLTLGNTSGFTNTFSGVNDDLIYLTGNSNLTIQNGATNNLSPVLASSGNFNIGSGSNLAISSVISGSGKSITKTSGGTAVLSGANTYTGATTIKAGTLTAGAANTIPSGSSLVLNGGTFKSGATTGFTQSIGTLTLSDNSTITLGTGSHTVTFTASNGVTWTSGKTLTVTGWAGGYDGTSGTAGKISVGANASGLTASQLAQIVFFNGTSNFQATILSTGEVVPLAPGNTISGTVFDANGVPITGGRTIKLIQNGTVSGTTATSNGSGVYTFSSLTLASGDRISTFIDGAGEKGVTATLIGTPADITNFDIKASQLTVRTDNGGSPAITNSNLADSDSSKDADIPYSVVSGALTTTAGTSLQINLGGSYAPGGNINDGGNWTNNGTFTAGSNTVTFNGTANQSIGGNNATTFATLAINPTNNAIVSLAVNTSVSTALNILTGVFSQGETGPNDFSLTTNAVSVAFGATWRNLGKGDLQLAGNVSNEGAINFNANGATCEEVATNDIHITSSGAARIWSGTGTFSMTDVDVKDQTAAGIPTLPAVIIVNSGNDSGGNTRWTFTSTCAGPFTWIGGANQDWTVATNWSPVRTSAALATTTDQLIFDGNVTPTPIITNVPSQQIATLSLRNNNISVTLRASGVNTLTIAGSTGNDLSIAAGTSLNLETANALNVTLAAGSAANVDGSTPGVRGAITMLQAAHRLIGTDANAITFKSGASFTAGSTVTTGFTGNPFDTGTNGSVVFESGANGFFNEGADPFGGSGHTVTTFNLGSTARFRAATAFSTLGRTYGNLILDGNQTYSGSGSNETTVLNNFELESGSSLILSGSAGGDLNLFGHFEDQNSAAGTFNPNGRTVKFQGGSTTQTIFKSPSNPLSFFDVFINETAGGKVQLLSPVTINGQLNLSTADSLLQLNNQTLSLNGTVIGPGNLKGDAVATLNIGGTGGGLLGTLKLVADTQTQLSQMTMNRTGSGSSVTFGNDLYIDDVLNLTNGIVDMGAFTLTINGNVTRTNGWIIGNEQRFFFCTNPCSVTFDVGTSNGYSPVSEVFHVNANFTYSQTVKAVEGQHPSIHNLSANALRRYWTLNTPSPAIGAADITFKYRGGTPPGGDVPGTESNYKIFRYAGSFTQFNPSVAIDTVNHTATLNGVINFSDWTLAEAAAVTPGNLQFSAANFDDTEQNSSTHPATITVRRVGGSDGAVSVHWATSAGTASTGADYTDSSGDLNWADGDFADKTFTVTVAGDSVYEANETVNLTLTAPTGGAGLGTPNPATLTITNDDGPPSTTLTVNTTDDVDHGACLAAHCSLREAINAANFSSDANTIDFNIPPGDPGCSGGVCTIILAGSEIPITNNVIIDGPGANLLKISGNNQSRIFFTSNSSVTIQKVTLENGNGAGSNTNGCGGAIYHNQGTLILDSVAVQNNSASTCNGGGVYFDGGIGGNHQIINSTFSNNTAGNCGAFINSSAPLLVLNSTFSGNTATFASAAGGGICNNAQTTIISSTITDNHSVNGGGVSVNSGTLNIRNTIVAGNSATSSGPDVFGAFNSEGHNFIGKSDGSSGFGAAGDQVGTIASALDPMLDPLANYGGPTSTHRLLANSPAIDTGDNCVINNTCAPTPYGVSLTTDQRGTGFDRKIDGNSDGTATVDKGAYEAPTCTTLPATPVASNGGPYCEAATIQLSTATVSGATYSWTGPNGFSSSDQNPTRSNATAADAGTYSVTVTVDSCTSAAGTTNVVVNSTPATPTASNGGPYCEAATIQLSTPTVSGATYSWTGPNGFSSIDQNPTRSNATAAEAGTYSVTVTVNGCTSAAGTTNVVVNATPATPAASNGGPYVEDGTIQLSTPSVAGATYSWTGPNSFTSLLQNPTRSNATTVDAGTYSVTVTVNGCTSAAGATSVIVNPPPPDTDVAVSGINLVITDANGGNTDDTLTISLNGSNVRINDPNHTLNCGAGAATIDAHTCEVPLASISGNIQVNTLGGNDALTLDLSGGDFIPNVVTGGVVYDGGTQTGSPGDKLVIAGGAQGTVEYNYYNANDGDIVMSNFGTVVYTGLEPITNTGTSTDAIFKMPTAVANIATLSDLGGGSSRLSSTGTFEQTDFVNPSNSLTISGGDLNDAIDVNALAANFPSLSISGGKGNDNVNINGNITFASDANLDLNLLNDDPAPSVDSVFINAQVIMSGNGTIDIQVSEAVVVNGSGVLDGKLQTENGSLKVEANQQATPTTGDFVGVTVDDGVIESTGSGFVSILGKGGDDSGGIQFGVSIQNGGLVSGGASSFFIVNGTGGAAGGNNNHGVLVTGTNGGGTGSKITSHGVTAQVTGTGGGTATGTGATNSGVVVEAEGQITAGGTGTVTVTGQGGLGIGGSHRGVHLTGANATITSSGGQVQVNGTGGGDPGQGGNLMRGVFVTNGGSITAGGTAAVIVTGVAGQATGVTHEGVTVEGGSITAANSIKITGTAVAPEGGISVADTGAVSLSAIGGTIEMIADSVRISTSSGAVDAQSSGTVNILQRTDGTEINLGGPDSAGTLGLSDAELDRVTAGRLNIGDNNSGAITVSSDITRLASTNMSLTSNSDILVSGGQVNTLGGTLLLDSGNSPAAVKPTKSSTDVTASTLSFGSDLAFVINGTTVDADYTQLNVVGMVNITGVTLVLSGSHTPSAGQQFIIVDNDASDAITGNFTLGAGGTDANGGLLAEGDTITNFLGSSLNATITYLGGTNNNDVVLTLTAPPCPTVTIDQTTLPDGTQGSSYPNTTITASGGTSPYSFAVTTGNLPGGLTLDSNGLLHGTPTVGGTFSFTVTVTDANDCTGAQAYTVKICPTSLVVNTTGDDPDFSPGDGVCETASGNGFCTLRAAIMESNALTSCAPLTITFSLLPGSEPQLITLESALPPITRNVTIQGPTGQMVSVDGVYSYRIFEISLATSVSISNLVIQNAAEANNGAGLLNSGSATVNLSNCVFTGNVTEDANGAAIYNAAGTLNIWNCTIANNQALYSGNGGGIYNHNGTVNLTNDTISGNGADTNGGGVYNNTGTVNVRNTIIAGNPSPGWDIFGAFNSLGHNIIGAGDTGSGFADAVNNDHVGSMGDPFDPLLGIFDDHGGSTLTFSLSPNSAAIDGGDDCVLTGCSGASPTITADQRGVTRPQGAHVDIGAFELQTYVVNTTADHAPGPCEPLSTGDCTLREAINAANSDFQDPSRIVFDIPTGGSDPGCVSGVCTIALDNTQGVLPAITTQVIIDGYTQSGAKPNALNLGTGDDAELKIVVSGVNLGAGAIGLDFCPGSNNSSVQGLVINNFQGIGIRLKNDGSNQVQGNFIGTDVTGMLAAPNGTGVAVVDGLGSDVGGEDPAARNLISGNTGDGVRISGYNTGVTFVEGNFIGTKKDGVSALANNIGVNLFGFTGANIIGCETENGDNVISWNTVAGIRIKESTLNLVEGNRIGTDNTGAVAAPNGIGVDICDASDNAIGADGFGNLISGNTGAGIRIKTTAGSSCPSQNNVIYRNKIGTNFQGLGAIPNDTGILVQDSTFNDIGSGDVQDRNIISGNTHEGIRLENSEEIVIWGNYIGTDVTGCIAVANGAGVEISGGNANQIGCTFYGSGNVISGNTGDGVEITGSAYGNFVQNNRIGVQANTSSPLPNGGIGVEVYVGATDNIIGVEPSGGGDEETLRTPPDAAAKGTARVAKANAPMSAGGGCSKRGTSNSQNTEAFKAAQQLKSKAAALAQKSSQFAGRAAKSVAAAKSLAGAKVKGTAAPNKDGIRPSIMIITGANVIANNGEEGVRVSSPGDINNRISQNSIYSNGKLGINLVGGLVEATNGVTDNDVNDPDNGPNCLQNYPVISSAITNGGTTISGTLNSRANQDYLIEFFKSNNPSPGKDPSGYGEGQTFIGSTSVTTVGNNASFSFNPLSPVALGSWITATATDNSGNTSEFSGAVQVTGPVSDVSVAIASPSPATVPEDSGTNIVYRFTRTDSSTSLTVDFAVSGTASFTGSDYTQTGAGAFTNTSGQVTFNTGEFTVDVVVHPTADGNPEADETVIFTLLAVAGSGYNVVAPSTATGTILNDDTCPTSFLVTHANDSHDVDPGDGACLDSSQRCTLRAAIEEANALVSCGTIDINFAFSSETIIVLPLGELSVQHNVNINGPTTYYLSIDGNGQYRAFDINSGNTVSISNLTVTDCVTNGNGGGILNTGTLTLRGVTVKGNTAVNGGGIATNNLLTLINTTISGNNATGDGGGLYSATGIAALTNVTIAYNTANSDDAGTESGGGIFVASGDVNLHNTIVADNLTGTVSPTADDIGGPVNAASSYNVIGPSAGGLIDGPNNNQVGVATAFLKPLQENGGSTLTHALTYKSPAVDTGDGCVLTGCGGSSPVVAVDQRGLPRNPPNDGDDNGTSGVDIGAYERQVTETRDVFTGFTSSVDVVDAIITFPCVQPCVGERVNPGSAKRDAAVAPAFATPTASLASLDPASGPAPLTSLIRTPNLVIGNSSSPPLPAFEVKTTATYTPPATVCFYLPAITSSTFFSGLRVLHREAGPNTTYGDSDDTLFEPPGGTTTNFTTKLACVQVQSFSAFAIAHTVTPTAANGTVSGQVVDTNGNPVEGAAVRMNGSQNRLTITDAEGKYRFDEVETNGLYVVTPSRANFTFNPSQRSFSQLGAHTDATFTASPAAGALNPLDATEYFVRQQYLDFLGREPDEAGFNFWVNNIESCGNNVGCREVKRIDTSAAFFLSIEFQQTGYAVYRTYQAAFGELRDAPVPLQLTEFRGDAAQISKGVIVLQDGWQRALENNKKLFAEDFVKRARFAAAYPLTMTPTEFVDKLFANAGIPITDDDHAAAIAEFARATDTSDVTARGRALRRVAENSTLTSRQFNRAFVLMEYFGYLRRDPNSGQDRDFAGYNFWLDKLDRFSGNFQEAEMVKAFLSSTEYRARFPR